MKNEKGDVETLSFEAALSQLEAIVETLESGDNPLESLVGHYERGTQLLKHCQKQLGEAELSLQKLETGSDLSTLEPLDI